MVFNRKNIKIGEYRRKVSYCIFPYFTEDKIYWLHRMVRIQIRDSYASNDSFGCIEEKEQWTDLVLITDCDTYTVLRKDIDQIIESIPEKFMKWR